MPVVYVANIEERVHKELSLPGMSDFAVQVDLPSFFSKVAAVAAQITGNKYQMVSGLFGAEQTAMLPFNPNSRQYLWVHSANDAYDNKGKPIRSGDVAIINPNKRLTATGSFKYLCLEFAGDCSLDMQDTRWVHLDDVPDAINRGCATADTDFHRKFPISSGIYGFMADRSVTEIVDSHDVGIRLGPEAHHTKFLEIYHVRAVKAARHDGVAQAVHIHPDYRDPNRGAYIEAIPGDLILFEPGVVHQGCAARKEDLGKSRGEGFGIKLEDGLKFVNVIPIPGFVPNDENIARHY